MGDRVWAGAPEPQPDGPQEPRVVAKVLLPLTQGTDPSHWAHLMDRARELAAIHECRVSVIVDEDKYGLPWAVIYTDPTGVRA